MRIDVHSHYIPKSLIERLEEPRLGIDRISEGMYKLKVGSREVSPLPYGAFDLGARIKWMEEVGIDVQVLSVTHHLFLYKSEPKLAVRACRLQNEEIAIAVKEYPDRFVGNATLPLQDPKLALEELDYAYSKLELRGVCIGTNVAGKNLDEGVLHPVYERIQELEMPIFVHPNDVMAPERYNRYYTPIMIGTLAETTLAVVSLIFGGVMDEFPRLKFIFPHGGAAIPYQAGRLKRAAEVREECKGKVKRTVKDYLEMIYFDTILFDVEALEYLLKFSSPRRLVLGSDYPFNMGEDYPARALEELKNISSQDKAMIFEGNAKQLYRL